jgi:hypothetical protein
MTSQPSNNTSPMSACPYIQDPPLARTPAPPTEPTGCWLLAAAGCESRAQSPAATTTTSHYGAGDDGGWGMGDGDGG